MTQTLITCEADLSRYFRAHLSDFGYTKALVDAAKGRYPSYPDYYCIRESDGKVERVELEVFSHTFCLHGHDTAGVDKIVCAEDNELFYHQYPSYLTKTVSVGLEVSPQYARATRCIYRARAVLNTMGGHRERLLYQVLGWHDHPGICRICLTPLGTGDTRRLTYTKEDAEGHQICLSKAAVWLSLRILSEKYVTEAWHYSQHSDPTVSEQPGGSTSRWQE